MNVVDPDRLIFDGGIRGMLSALDPFSAFFDRDQFELLQQQTRGQAMGFGSILYVQPGKVLVLETAQGSPSWRAGLGPGDEIVEINGQRVDSLDFQSLIELLRRSRSRPVHLGVLHPGKYVAQNFELKPAEMALPTVDNFFRFKKTGIGYMHILGFEAKTTREVIEALSKMGGPALQGLLLDLRDNHGGMLASAIGVASLFLKPDAVVLTIRGRKVPEKGYRTAPPPVHYDFPIIVLVNGETASAAEVLTAALEDHDRAVVAGEPTYGKGVVETVMPLEDGTGLALTTAQYFTPSGRSIQRPLPGTALAESTQGLEANANFRTDDGRPLAASGGITPDVQISPRVLDPWVNFLNQRGLFTNFASRFLTLHSRVSRSFEPDAQMLAEFKDFLEQANIRAPEEYWGPDQDYLKLRIKTEIFNLSFGLTVGNEVATRGDPQVLKALTIFPDASRLLKGPDPVHRADKSVGISERWPARPGL